jgi:hypothetical protein
MTPPLSPQRKFSVTGAQKSRHIMIGGGASFYLDED